MNEDDHNDDDDLHLHINVESEPERASCTYMPIISTFFRGKGKIHIGPAGFEFKTFRTEGQLQFSKYRNSHRHLQLQGPRNQTYSGLKIDQTVPLDIVHCLSILLHIL